MNSNWTGSKASTMKIILYHPILIHLTTKITKTLPTYQKPIQHESRDAHSGPQPVRMQGQFDNLYGCTITQMMILLTYPGWRLTITTDTIRNTSRVICICLLVVKLSKRH